MRCMYCSSEHIKVIDSRSAEEGNATRRRRQCEECGRRFTTYEKIEMMPIMVIKKDKSREIFDREKIEAGILRSCHKRAVSIKQIQGIVDDIENNVYNVEEGEIESSVLGEMVMDKLRVLDQVAYVRFASVYREFKDVSTFMKELEKLLV